MCCQPYKPNGPAAQAAVAAKRGKACHGFRRGKNFSRPSRQQERGPVTIVAGPDALGLTGPDRREGYSLAGSRRFTREKVSPSTQVPLTSMLIATPAIAATFHCHIASDSSTIRPMARLLKWMATSGPR